MSRPRRRKDAAPSEGAEARVRAESNLAATKARWPEVKRVSKSLRQLRERNHFSDQLQAIFQGGPRR